MVGKMGNLGSSFREMLVVGGKFGFWGKFAFLYIKNTFYILGNSTCIPGHKHFPSPGRSTCPGHSTFIERGHIIYHGKRNEPTKLLTQFVSVKNKIAVFSIFSFSLKLQTHEGTHHFAAPPVLFRIKLITILTLYRLILKRLQLV